MYCTLIILAISCVYSNNTLNFRFFKFNTDLIQFILERKLIKRKLKKKYCSERFYEQISKHSITNEFIKHRAGYRIKQMWIKWYRWQESKWQWDYSAQWFIEKFAKCSIIAEFISSRTKYWSTSICNNYNYRVYDKFELKWINLYL